MSSETDQGNTSERVAAELSLRVTAQIAGVERCVVCRNQRLTGDREWIEAALGVDPELASRSAVDIVHVFEEIAGAPVRLLIADQQADHSLSHDGLTG